MDKRIAVLIFSLLLWTGHSNTEDNVTSPPSTGTSQNTAKPSSSPVAGASTFKPISTSPEGHSNTEGNVSSPPSIAGASTFKPSSTSPEASTTLSTSTSTRNPAKINESSTQAPPGTSGNRNDAEHNEKMIVNYNWIWLPALCILLVVLIYLIFKCKKVQHRPEMTENGTENASFQRTDSNKDGVMLLGVSKTASGEENEEGKSCTSGMA
ncbi:uncharacterized protein LOC127644584 isoform X10 [Xyrauchen texanus]|uniref:uncharacterized protein LOC127644584 isoform X10 n=1 Tax=Xyrauchen texanus TaxID=154827 RepID=UPI0022425B96|nr:uncharacterized protein LOC127644584 isoform X10 [Xyrauchen texanus]